MVQRSIDALQPLADNLESATYQTFERDAPKYERYGAALRQALHDAAFARSSAAAAHAPGAPAATTAARTAARGSNEAGGSLLAQDSDGSNSAVQEVDEAEDAPVQIMVLGAGRGPLVAAALRAADSLGIPVQVRDLLSGVPADMQSAA